MANPCNHWRFACQPRNSSPFDYSHNPDAWAAVAFQVVARLQRERPDLYAKHGFETLVKTYREDQEKAYRQRVAALCRCDHNETCDVCCPPQAVPRPACKCTRPGYEPINPACPSHHTRDCAVGKLTTMVHDVCTCKVSSLRVHPSVVPEPCTCPDCRVSVNQATGDVRLSFCERHEGRRG